MTEKPSTVSVGPLNETRDLCEMPSGAVLNVDEMRMIENAYDARYTRFGRHVPLSAADVTALLAVTNPDRLVVEP